MDTSYSSCKKYGRICSIRINFQLKTTSISSQTQLFSGVIAPIHYIEGYAHALGNNSILHGRYCIKTDGSIYTYAKWTSDTSSAWWDLYDTYITES